MKGASRFSRARLEGRTVDAARGSVVEVAAFNAAGSAESESEAGGGSEGGASGCMTCACSSRAGESSSMGSGTPTRGWMS
jgi:hypothetical protein